MGLQLRAAAGELKQGAYACFVCGAHLVFTKLLEAPKVLKRRPSLAVPNAPHSWLLDRTSP